MGISLRMGPVVGPGVGVRLPVTMRDSLRRVLETELC